MTLGPELMIIQGEAAETVRMTPLISVFMSGCIYIRRPIYK